MVIGTDFAIYDCIANEECAFDIKTEDTTTCQCNHFVRVFLVIIALPLPFETDKLVDIDLNKVFEFF